MITTVHHTKQRHTVTNECSVERVDHRVRDRRVAFAACAPRRGDGTRVGITKQSRGSVSRGRGLGARSRGRDRRIGRSVPRGVTRVRDNYIKKFI